MIEVNDVRKGYYSCNACLANKREHEIDVLEISLGLSMYSTATIRLCLNCIEELKEKINGHLKGE